MDISEPSENLETLLIEHPIALELKQMGVVEEQLKSIRYWRRAGTDPLDRTPITWNGELNPQAIPIARAYCALKGLVDGSLVSAEDKETAHRIIAVSEIQPIIYAAEMHSRAQTDRAEKKRNKINEDGTSLKDVIQRLVLKPELAELTAKGLWPHLYSALDEIWAEPKDSLSQRNLNKSAYEYLTADGRRKHITFDRFQNIVSEVRKSR